MDQQLEGHDLIAQLLQSEQLNRAQEKTAMYLKLAKLRLPATIEQIECSPSRNLTKQQLATLAEGRYLDNGENLLITGSTGCGKSYLACALGHQACLQGYKTTYVGMNRLIEKITLYKLDGSYIKLLNYLERQTLIILDDFGLQNMSQEVRLTLLQLLEDIAFLVEAKTKTSGSSLLYLDQAGTIPIKVDENQLPPVSFNNTTDIKESIKTINADCRAD